MNNKSNIAITMGDYLGIGPEIIIKALKDIVSDLSFNPIIIGSYDILKDACKLCKINLSIYSISDVREIEYMKSQHIPVLDVGDRKLSLFLDGQISEPSAIGGESAILYIKQAVDLALSGLVDAIVTAPISKEAIHLAGFEYPGHTELLAELTNTKDFAMMLQGGDLRVVLVTTHCAIRDVSKFVTYDSVYRIIQLVHDWFFRYLKISPYIAVSALNPHAGESGIFGVEEDKEIIPAVSKAQREGINVVGPYPADTLFFKAQHIKYDVIITMYHDQGLIPLKMVAFGKSVNVTLGLPIIRTSVDHGTAYDIAWRGSADANSMIEAIKTAHLLAFNENLK